MAIKIRLARGGSKKRPFYRIVAADSRMPRDGRFIEKLGTYNPLLPKDSEERVKMNMERVQYWLGQGAQPTDRIARARLHELDPGAEPAAPDLTDERVASERGLQTLEQVSTDRSAVLDESLAFDDVEIRVGGRTTGRVVVVGKADHERNSARRLVAERFVDGVDLILEVGREDIVDRSGRHGVLSRAIWGPVFGSGSVQG